MAEPVGKKLIEGYEFTLFYDYDQLRDGKLSRLSDDGKIEWFRYRMEAVFLSPLKKLFDRKSEVYNQLNSSPNAAWPWTAMMTASFSILLNGVEALGSFLPINRDIIKEHYTGRWRNYFCFRAFITEYMKDWDAQIEGTSYRKNMKSQPYTKVYLPLILWDHFRNGIAHAFVVEGGGIEFKADDKRWIVEPNGYLEIGPIRFFDEFSQGLDHFFEDAKVKYRISFLSRFYEAYPH